MNFDNYLSEKFSAPKNLNDLKKLESALKNIMLVDDESTDPFPAIDFVKHNTNLVDAGIDPLESEHLEAVINLKVGKSHSMNMGAGGITTIKRVK